MVGDDERNEAQQAIQGVTDAGLKAQQANMNRAAQGSIQNAGQFQRAAQGLAATSADAAIKAGGEANRLQAAIRERRKAEALQAATALNESNRARAMEGLKMGVGTAMGIATAPTSSVAGLVAQNVLK